MENKGEYLGLCNLSSCTTHKPATYYNYGTSKYYCKECAERLNSDEYNQRDAMRMFGHDLCIEESVRPKPLNEIIEKQNYLQFTEPYIMELASDFRPTVRHSPYIKSEPSQQNII
jgi:hypothetical protein